MQQQRREIAMVIALQAFLECDDDEEKALELIDSMVDNLNLVDDIDNAYQTVYDARKNDHEEFVVEKQKEGEGREVTDC